MSGLVDKIELIASTFYFDEEGILWIIHKDGVEMGLPEAQEHAETCLRLCSGTRTRMIIDSRGKSTHVTAEARNYLAHHEELVKVRKAHAIIVDSLANRLIANFYFKFNKPKGPGRVFNSEKEALAWLTQYK